MRERPILFSAPMVRALLAGTKTQTRRMLKPQPWARPEGTDDGRWQLYEADVALKPFDCPYGKPGDRLWVRETWRTHAQFDGCKPSGLFPGCALQYEAGGSYLGHEWHRVDAPLSGALGRLRPGMFMPRWAATIRLEVVDVRVQRLQEITEADAIAEGVDAVSVADVPRQASWNRRQDFSQLWDSINGKRAPWSANPWVWAITFRRVA